jgi:hypothetical protein
MSASARADFSVVHPAASVGVTASDMKIAASIGGVPRSLNRPLFLDEKTDLRSDHMQRVQLPELS